MSKKLYFILSLFVFIGSTAQSKDGYWDNIRTTNETIILKAGEKKFIKSANFPEGTTEVVYRITMLDDNQKISSSLVSVLKSIPDPTGISQGTAGAVFLLSTISGDDECKYAIYQNVIDVENYIKTGKNTNACFVQSKPINKEAKLLSTSSKCLLGNIENLFFTFESNNWIMNQKIVLEIVPWIDIKSSRGWNSETKKEILAIAQKQEVVKSLSKKDEFYAIFIENIGSKYKYSEFKQLISVEKNRTIEQSVEESLKKSGEVEKYYDVIRNKSLKLFNSGKTNEAIDVIASEMIAKKRANYKDYGILGDYYLLLKQYTKAEEIYNQGLKQNPSEINFQLNLAHVYLFTDKVSQAKDIHEKYSNQTLFTGNTWKEQVKLDFKEFQKFGLPTDNFKKILRIIE